MIRSASIFAAKTDQAQERLQGLAGQAAGGITPFFQDGLELFPGPVQTDFDILQGNAQEVCGLLVTSPP